MPLSAANCVTRVPSSNQRNARIACLKQPNARVSGAGTRRMPFGVQQTGQEQHGVLGHVRTALYVTLMAARNPYEDDLWKDHFIPGFCVLRGISLGVSATASATTQRQRPLLGMAQGAVR